MTLISKKSKHGISKGKMTTIVVLSILLFFITSLNILEAMSARDVSGGRTSLVSLTITQIGDTAGMIRDYTRSFFTGKPLPGRDSSELEPSTNQGGSSATLSVLSPPTTGSTTLLNSIVPRSEDVRGTFIVNANMRANQNFEVSGVANVGDITALGTATTSKLAVLDTMESLGLITASGGIATNGSNINLEGGDLLGIDFVRQIVAGQNVEISVVNGVVTVSVPDAGKSSGGKSSSAGVASINGQAGMLSLLGGTDIEVTGLVIENISTLASVRLRGGCLGCITDEDVADNLTIIGGAIEDTIIGATNQAAGYFTRLSVGTTSTASMLTVMGDASFTGSVSGASAVELNQFVTLNQLNSAIIGAAGVGSINSLSGALFIVGTAGQITVDSVGSTITLGLPQDIASTATPSFAGLLLNGLLDVTGNVDVSGVVTAGTLQTAGGYSLTSGSVFREVQPIFGFDVPIRCSAACNNTFVTISRAIENYSFPTAYAGTTREHNFTIHYADSLSSGATSWRVYNTTALAVVDTFTVPASPTSSLDGSSAVYTTGDVAIPTNGDGWVLQVSMPLGGTMQVNQVFMGAYDVIN